MRRGVVGRGGLGSGEFDCRRSRSGKDALIGRNSEGRASGIEQDGGERYRDREKPRPSNTSLCSTSRPSRDRVSLHSPVASSRLVQLPSDMPSPSISALINTVSGDLDYTNRKTHQAIYGQELTPTELQCAHCSPLDRIKGHVLPTVSPDDCPPLPLMIYAIRNILEPTLVLSLIPELLKLLVHLEVLRTHTVSLANELLQPTGDTDPSGQSLDTDDREALVALTKPSRVSSQRTIFRKIIHACCLLVHPSPSQPPSPSC